MTLQPFNELSRTLIDEINAHGTLVTYRKGETCMQGDDTLEYFYLILKGRMKVFDIHLQNGREQTWLLLSKGDMFDVVTLLDGREHEVMTKALDDLSVIRLPIARAREWLQSHSAFNQLLLPYIASQMRSLESLSCNLSLYDTSQRLMRLIIDNLDPETGQPTLLGDLSHREMAAMIGSVRQVVERHLKQLREAGIITTGRKGLRVKNLARLKRQLGKFLSQ